ncbi:MAG: glycoside hydrolase family 30 protein [Ferruginibacter sp.]|nr:glycoside hydrolase family 30 protein [Ferruginibacter sp.]
MNIKKHYKLLILVLSMITALSKNSIAQQLAVKIFETSASGNKLTAIKPVKASATANQITLKPQQKYQTITGFGGSFTQSSAYLLNKLSKANRTKILQAYFGKQGANYSLTRTHINSCDFSTHQYAYNTTPNDTTLTQFDISEDEKAIVPMIKDAMKISKDGFKIIASPWTAPPWMKDNNNWVGGKLLPKYYDTWALYFSKYFTAFKKHNIKFWGITVENEPHGNGNNWESMLFSPKEMRDFVEFNLGPKLEKDGYGNVKILGYDQNRAGIKEWVDEMYSTPNTSKYYAGLAVHWYESTYDYFGEALQYAHQKNPSKHLINTEACVDAEVPKWKDDNWYWSKEATDWGWDWASEKEKYLHPKYVPVFRYAGDIIGCLNNYVDGWIDWNMVLDKQGGPNWFKNWCVAPVIVDDEKDEVYFTPLYYTMAHFSKFIRPGAVRIGFENADKELMVTAAKNVDGSIAVILFNPTEQAKKTTLNLNNKATGFTIAAKAIQTVFIK